MIALNEAQLKIIWGNMITFISFFLRETFKLVFFVMVGLTLTFLFSCGGGGGGSSSSSSTDNAATVTDS